MLFPRLARYKDVVSNFSLIKLLMSLVNIGKIVRSVGHIGLFTILTTPCVSRSIIVIERRLVKGE